jgi:hypothetical protein
MENEVYISKNCAAAMLMKISWFSGDKRKYPMWMYDLLPLRSIAEMLDLGLDAEFYAQKIYEENRGKHK